MLTGTLTFHSPNNNGSFLQAYALQRTLKDLGVENEIIHLYTKKQEAQYSVFRKISSGSDILRNLLSLLHYSKLKKRFDGFENIRNKYLNLTARLYTEAEASEIIKKYDCIICGSDQIWNNTARDFSSIYLLPDFDKKKITYAVSSGSKLDKENMEKMIPHIKKFNSISVRETFLYDRLKTYGINSLPVLDPTFLIDKSEYDKICSGSHRIKERYIFLYTISYNDNALKTARKIADRMNVQLVTCFTGYSYYKCLKYGIKVLYDVAPDDFLDLINNADAVCTNSFHGLAFSIIYRKKLFRLQNLDADNKCVIDDRLDGLMNKLNITDRNVNAVNADNYDISSEIDYEAVFAEIENLKKASIDYLKNALEVR